MWLPGAYIAKNSTLKEEILAELDVMLVESDESTVSSLQ